MVQAASQLSLAPSSGVPMNRVALAFPVSAVCAVVAGATLGAGLVFDPALPDWTRALVLLGLLTPIFLHRKLMAGVLGVARRFVHRIPHPDRLPTQVDILRSYGWAAPDRGLPRRRVRGPARLAHRWAQPTDDPLCVCAELDDRVPRHPHSCGRRHPRGPAGCAAPRRRDGSRRRRLTHPPTHRDRDRAGGARSEQARGPTPSTGRSRRSATEKGVSARFEPCLLPPARFSWDKWALVALPLPPAPHGVRPERYPSHPPRFGRAAVGEEASMVAGSGVRGIPRKSSSGCSIPRATTTSRAPRSTTP